MKKAQILAAIPLLMLAVGVPVVSQSESTTQTTSNKRVEFSEARGNLLRNRCAIVLQKINQIQDKTAEREERSQKLLNDWQVKLNDFSIKAQAEGLNVDKLSADLAEMNNLAGELSQAWDEFNQALAAIGAGVDCEDDETVDPEALHQEIETAKQSLDDLRQAIKAVKDFISTTIKADLVELRQQIANRNQAN